MLKAGSFTQEVPAHTQIYVEGQTEFVVVELQEGKAVDLVARSLDRECRFTTRKDCVLGFQIPGKQFISVDATPVKSHAEEVSSIPYEIPDENRPHLTLEEKLKVYLAEMVAERYGEDSKQMDTFEESMDFEDEEDEPLSGFEIGEFTEEVVEPITEPEKPEKTETEEPAAESAEEETPT